MLMRRNCLLLMIVLLAVLSSLASMAQAVTSNQNGSGWQPGTFYAAGKDVTFEGTSYRCVYAHTSVAGWEPPRTQALWQPAGVKQSASKHPSKKLAPIKHRIFAPYIHMSETNNDLAAIQADSGIKFFTLAFIVSDGKCSPAWQGKTPLPLATESLFSSHISRLRKSGGDVIVSFGGYVGQELAQACPDPKALAVAYQRVIDKYQIQSLDFDVEASAASDPASIERRSEALARLSRVNAGLQISFTVPVTPEGMPRTALDLLKSAKRHNVPVAVVNLMTMDYGTPVPDGNMGPLAIVAVDRAIAQIRSVGLTSAVGITPMIGKNDTKGETFTVDDARATLSYAKSNSEVRRLSMWSAGRDNGGCQETVSPTCSGIAQRAWEFTRVFNEF
jgi:hypothetical protein